MATAKYLLCQFMLVFVIDIAFGQGSMTYENHYSHGAQEHYPIVECPLIKQWRKLNDATPLCFGAKRGEHIQFPSSFGMNVELLKYVRRSGYHECMYGYGGYFGCEAYPLVADHYHEHEHHYEEASYYPSAHHDEQVSNDQSSQTDAVSNKNDTVQHDNVHADSAQDDTGHILFQQDPGPHYLQTISVFLTDENGDVLYPQPPFQKPYFIEPSVNRPAWDRSITMMVRQGPIAIDLMQDLRLYHGEDLYDKNSEDNSGTLCIDVYAYGEIVDPFVV